jgi:hypothetical protein
LNIDFGIKNERQDDKTGTVCGRGGTCGKGAMNAGDEDEAIGLMDFIYIKEIE